MARDSKRSEQDGVDAGRATALEPSEHRYRGLVPLVYACSGYSSAAQLANKLAVELDRRVEAEMSCIAGVGGNVPALVTVARSGRPIVAIDGCPLRCVAACLARVGVEPTAHVTLSDYGVHKRRHASVPKALVADVRARVRERVRTAAGTADAPPPRSESTADARSRRRQPTG